jgi:hypothetical protein
MSLLCIRKYSQVFQWALLILIVIGSIWLRVLGIGGWFGRSGDFLQAERQAMLLSDISFQDFYERAGGDRPDHPVALFRCLKIAAQISHAYGVPFSVVAKAFYASAEVATVLILAGFTLQTFGGLYAILVTGLYLLIPVFSYVGSFWGHHGCVEVFFTASSLLAMANRRYALSLAALGAALSFRIHSVVIAPFIISTLLIAPISWKKRLKAILLAIIVNAAFAAPLIKEVGLKAYSLQYTGHLSNYKNLTYGAYNIWSFPTVAEIANRLSLTRVCSAIPVCSKTIDDATILGLLLFALGYLAALAIYYYWKKQNHYLAVWIPATLIYLCFYFLPTRIHERYSYHFLVLCTPLAVRWGRFFVPYLVIVLTTLSSFYFFPSYLNWLQIQISARGEPSIVNELSILGFILILFAIVSVLIQKHEPHPSLTALQKRLVSLMSSSFIPYGGALLLSLFVFEWLSIFTCKQDLLESRLSESRAYNRDLKGAEAPGQLATNGHEFAFAGKHGWWSIGPRSFLEPTGVVARGTLIHPQHEVVRVLEIPINPEESELNIGARFDSTLTKNRKPAWIDLAVRMGDQILTRQTIQPNLAISSYKINLPGMGAARQIAIEVKGLDYKISSELDNLHLYLTAQAK